MTTMFLTVLDMSLSAAYVILFVFLLRWFWSLANLPRKFTYLLWGFVLLRLLVPAMPETGFSLLPDDFSGGFTTRWTAPEDVSPLNISRQQITQLEEGYRQAQNPGLPYDLPDGGNTYREYAPATDSAFTRLTPILTAAWLVGMLAMAVYNGISLLLLRRKLADSIPAGDGVYLNDHIDTAFVMGLLQPRIYLPAHLSEAEQRFILAHERYHIRRRDHAAKLIGFAALTLHWFNPLVWLAFSAAVKDMELSCDEAVTGDMSADTRSHYAETLLHLTTGRKGFSIAPVAFGEGDVSRRIRHVFTYRKPTPALTVVVLLLVALLIPGLLTNPRKKTATFGASVYQVDKTGFSYEDPFITTDMDGPFMLTTDHSFLRFHSTAGWTDCGTAEDYPLTAEEMKDMLHYNPALKQPVAVTEILDSKLVRYTTDTKFVHSFFLLTRHKDGSRFISYGSCFTDNYQPEDMFIHKLFDVDTGLDESSNNGPFYARTISGMVGTPVTTIGTHHVGGGVQIVGFAPNNAADFDLGWTAFRIKNGTATYLRQLELFETTEDNGGVFFGTLPLTAEETEYNVVLVNNPLISHASVAVDDNNNEIHYLEAPDMLVLPRGEAQTKVHFYYADGIVFDADGTVLSAESHPDPMAQHQLVQIDGSLYYNTLRECTPVNTRPDGTIDATLRPGQTPTEDNQSNFGTGYPYHWHMEPYYVDVGIDGKVYRFKQVLPSPNAYGITLNSTQPFKSFILTIACTRDNTATRRICPPDSFTLINMDTGTVIDYNIPIKTDDYILPGESCFWTADISHLSHLISSGTYRAELRFTFPDMDGEPFYSCLDFVYEA